MKKQAEYIKRIEIKGLWGRKNIAWDLRPDVNILSGVNVTCGKYWKKCFVACSSYGAIYDFYSFRFVGTI